MFPSDRHQYFSLRWNNYQNNMTSVFHQLLETQSFVDVTLACENNSLKAHKVVLSACSTFFQKLLLENPCDHATIIMPSDICFADLQFIIKFVYRGEIDVSEPELQSLLRTAEHLKIKGLCDITENSSSSTTTNSTTNSNINNNNNNPTATNPGTSSCSSEYNEPFVKRKLKNNQNLKHHQQQQQLQQQQQQQQQQHNKSNSSSSTSNSNNNLNNSKDNINEDLPKQQQRDHNINNEPTAQSSSLTLENKLASTENRGDKNMTSLGMGMGMNGSLMGVSMQFLDFAPEPPAPSATPVTEHVELNTNSTQDQEIRRKFETLRSLDPSDNLEVDRLSQHSIHQLTQHSPSSSSSPHHPDNNHDRRPPTDTIIIKTSPPLDHSDQHSQSSQHSQQGQQQHHQQQQQQQQQQQHQQQQQQIQQQSDNHNSRSSNNTMDVDQSGMESEPLHGMVITPEIVTMMTPSQMVELYQSDTSEDSKMMVSEIKPEYTELTSPNNPNMIGPKNWTQDDMNSALDALQTNRMGLTKAAVTYGIPSTTLWQRAHRMGIDTPKKEGPNKSWNEDSLNHALEALRTGQISANKASKAYGIPSSTLYKIARREGIRLAAPFNAAPTTWTAEDLERALEAIRSGQASVQKASVEFGIPTGTLYGRCKREGIELSRSNPTPWSEDAMNEALEAVRVGQMSINQAAIHYNLPYSSLYGRFKRGKYDTSSGDGHMVDTSPENTYFSQQQYSPLMVHHQQQQQQPPPQQQQQSSHMLQQQHNSSSQEMFLIQPKIERS